LCISLTMPEELTLTGTGKPVGSNSGWNTFDGAAKD